MSTEDIREISVLPDEVGTDTWVTQTSLDGHVLYLSQRYQFITCYSVFISQSEYLSVNKTFLSLRS